MVAGKIEKQSGEKGPAEVREEFPEKKKGGKKSEAAPKKIGEIKNNNWGIGKGSERKSEGGGGDEWL